MFVFYFTQAIFLYGLLAKYLQNQVQVPGWKGGPLPQHTALFCSEGAPGDFSLSAPSVNLPCHLLISGLGARKEGAACSQPLSNPWMCSGLSPWSCLPHRRASFHLFQGIIWPQVLSGIVGNCVNGLANYVLVSVLSLGVR